MNFIQTDGGLHIVLNGKQTTLHKSDKSYGAVILAIKEKKSEQEVLDLLDAEKNRMQEAIKVVPSIELKGGQLYHHGEIIEGTLGNRMLTMIDEGFDLVPMSAFLKNLADNPSFRVVQHLYPFLEKGKNPITDDGCFLAYKAVNPDWTSIHPSPSGVHLDNSIGQIVSMPRNKVDENPSRTCSYGLHVCSFDYLPHFAHNNGHVVVVKVNPADVVAIPADYNDTKMRVCRYEVIGEYENYYVTPENVLANTSVNNDVLAIGTFSVETRSGRGKDYVVEARVDRLSEAAAKMENLLEDPHVFSARIVNAETIFVLDEKQNSNFDSDFDDFDESFDSEDSFYVFRFRNGQAEQLGQRFDSVSEAVGYALDEDTADTYEIRDGNGHLMKTIS